MRMRDVARGKKQQVQLERRNGAAVRRVSRRRLLNTVITTSARRIHRSGPGSRALQFESKLANKSCMQHR